MNNFTKEKTIEQLTDIQYKILTLIEEDWFYPFSHFGELNLNRKELSREFKILREAGIVEFQKGLMTEEGEVAGSGYGINHKVRKEANKLIDDWEESNKQLLKKEK